MLQQFGDQLIFPQLTCYLAVINKILTKVYNTKVFNSQGISISGSLFLMLSTRLQKGQLVFSQPHCKKIILNIKHNAFKKGLEFSMKMSWGQFLLYGFRFLIQITRFVFMYSGFGYNLK